MNHVRAGAWMTMGGLALLLTRPIAPPHAQEQTGAQALLDRIPQIQGQLAPGGAPHPQNSTARARELIERIELIKRDTQSAASAPERPALGEDEVRRLVQEGLGVDVLSIEAVEHDGRPAYAVTVMKPPGNYNGAFQVTTLLVDGATGGLLGQVPHAPRTRQPEVLPGSPVPGPDGSGLEIRRRTYR